MNDALGSARRFAAEVSKAIRSQQGGRVKPLFRLDNQLLHQALFGLGSLSEAALRGACVSAIGDEDWGLIVSNHLRALDKRASNAAAAFKLYTESGGPIKAVVQAILAAPQLLWVAAVLEQLIENGIVLAREADQQMDLGANSSKYNALATALQGCAHELGGVQRAEDIGRWRGNLTVLIMLTKVLQRINNVSQCTQMVRTFKQQYPADVLQHIPASFRVSAYYYMGRTEVACNNMDEGMELLDNAFRECKADSRNVPVILRALVPLKMMNGIMPSPQLLRQYGLQDYLVFRDALVAGDVGAFARALSELTVRMVADGNFLLYEKLQFLAYRRLVKRVADLNRSLGDAKTAHHVSLEVVLGVLQAQGLLLDMDELECTLANCISQKFIKGYISNKQKVLVLAKGDDAFPPPCREWWSDPVFSQVV